MSVKLTDTQLVMLRSAAQRDDLCLATPDKMKGAVLSKVSESFSSWAWSERFEPRRECRSGDAKKLGRATRSNCRRPG